MSIGQKRDCLRQVLLAAAVLAFAGVAAGQPPAYKAPRSPDGKPNLNGIWQAANTANWDIQTHVAKPALMTVPGPAAAIPAQPVLAFGAVGSVPGGLGVVEGE